MDIAQVMLALETIAQIDGFLSASMRINISGITYKAISEKSVEALQESIRDAIGVLNCAFASAPAPENLVVMVDTKQTYEVEM